MIDQVTRGNRDASMQDILNTIDGGDTKGMNVITLFTTNHIELIEPTFLRGKRIGTIISLTHLDSKTADEFIRESFRNQNYVLEDDLSEVCKLVEDSKIVPAFMAEIVESVKSNLIFLEENNNVVKNDYIIACIRGYLRQVDLAKTKDMTSSPEQRLADSLVETIVTPVCKEVMKTFEVMKDNFEVNEDDINKRVEKKK